jgi:hypothetical protein
MTENYKVLGQTVSYPSSYQEVVAYEVPEGKQASISAIEITNAGNSTVDYKINAVPSADVPDTEQQTTIDGDGIVANGQIRFAWPLPADGYKLEYTKDGSDWKVYDGVFPLPFESTFFQNIRNHNGSFYTVYGSTIYKSDDFKTWTILLAANIPWSERDDNYQYGNSFELHVAKNKVSLYVNSYFYPHTDFLLKGGSLIKAYIVRDSDQTSYTYKQINPSSLFPTGTWTPWGTDSIFINTSHEIVDPVASRLDPFIGVIGRNICFNAPGQLVFDENHDYDFLPINLNSISTDWTIVPTSIIYQSGKYFSAPSVFGNTFIDVDPQRLLLWSYDLLNWYHINLVNQATPYAFLSVSDNKLINFRDGWANNGASGLVSSITVNSIDTNTLEVIGTQLQFDNQIDYIWYQWPIFSQTIFGPVINVQVNNTNLNYYTKINPDLTCTGKYKVAPYGVNFIQDPLIYGTRITSKNKHNILRSSIAPGINNEIKGGITLSEGDRITIAADSSDVIINVYGVEIE